MTRPALDPSSLAAPAPRPGKPQGVAPRHARLVASLLRLRVAPVPASQPLRLSSPVSLSGARGRLRGAWTAPKPPRTRLRGSWRLLRPRQTPSLPCSLFDPPEGIETAPQGRPMFLVPMPHTDRRAQRQARAAAGRERSHAQDAPASEHGEHPPLARASTAVGWRHGRELHDLRGLRVIHRQHGRRALIFSDSSDSDSTPLSYIYINGLRI